MTPALFNFKSLCKALHSAVSMTYFIYCLFYFFSFSRKPFIRDKSTWLTVTGHCAKRLSKSQGRNTHKHIRKSKPTENCRIAREYLRWKKSKEDARAKVSTGVNGWSPLSSLCQFESGENLDVPAQSDADGTGATQVRARVCLLAGKQELENHYGQNQTWTTGVCNCLGFLFPFFLNLTLKTYLTALRKKVNENYKRESLWGNFRT